MGRVEVRRSKIKEVCGAVRAPTDNRGCPTMNPDPFLPGRVLLQTTTCEPGGLVGGVGAGLFCIIFFGIVAMFAFCLSQNSDHPKIFSTMVVFLYALVWAVIYLPPKESRCAESTDLNGFYSDWLWMYLFMIIIAFLGAVASAVLFFIMFMSRPIYALEEDRMNLLHNQ